jgi:hypothetical protein
MTSLLSFMKIYQFVSNLLVGDTDGQTSDLISLPLIFTESRVKMENILEGERT